MTREEYQRKIQEKRAAKPQLSLAGAEIEGKKAAPVIKERPAEKWNPVRLLDIPADLKDSRYTYRWCNKDKQGNIRKKASEGWEVDYELSKKLNSRLGLNKTLDDGSGVDSTLQMRELIVMRLPKEKAEARRKYYADQGMMDATEMRRQFRQRIAEGTGDERAQVYTKHPFAPGSVELNEVRIRNGR